MNFNNQQKGKERSCMLAWRPSDLACVARVAKLSDSKASSDHSNIKILSPKQMVQRLTITLAQVKACNTCENLLNETSQII